jgi:hypothetical protein
MRGWLLLDMLLDLGLGCGGCPQNQWIYSS